VLLRSDGVSESWGSLSHGPRLPAPHRLAKTERRYSGVYIRYSCYCGPAVEEAEAKITTDVGLEPTASALGGLRATIAPTGQTLIYEKNLLNNIYNLYEQQMSIQRDGSSP
jgi:hypothetical protein